jgi:hypothetical protein
MTDTIPSTLRMLVDRDKDRIGNGYKLDLVHNQKSQPQVSHHSPNRFLKPINAEPNPGFAWTIDIDNAGYGYNYPMQFWPSRNNTQQPVGFVTPNKDDPNAIASIRFRPQLRTVNFEPNLNKGWWGYWDPVWDWGATAKKRDANPQFLLGYKDIAYGLFNRYRSRHAMPCTGGSIGQVTCLPCLREHTGDRIQQNIQNSATGQNTQCQALTSPVVKQSSTIPQGWKDVMNEAGVEWRDGRPSDIDNLKVQDLFPCPMPDFVHRLGPANIPHDVMSRLLADLNPGKDIPEANFYTCEYKSGAIDSTEKLKTFLEYVNEGEVAPCCTTNPSESCTFVPSNATIPFLQGMPDDFAANLLTNFEINVGNKGQYCQSELDSMLGQLNDTLNSVTIRSGKHGKLRTALLNLRTTLLSREGVDDSDCPRFKRHRACKIRKQEFIDNLIALAQSDGSCQDFNQPCANLQIKEGSTCRTFRECLDERFNDEVALDCGVDCELEAFGDATKCALGPGATEEISQVRLFKRLVAKTGELEGNVYRTAKVRQRGTKGLEEGVEGKLCTAFGREAQGRDGIWYVSTSTPCKVKDPHTSATACASVVRDLGTQPPSTGQAGEIVDGRCRLEEMEKDCPRLDCSIQWNAMSKDQVDRTCAFNFKNAGDQSGWDGYLVGVKEYTERGTLTKPQCSGTPCSESYRVLSDAPETQTVERTRECPLQRPDPNMNFMNAEIEIWKKFPNAHRVQIDCHCNGGVWENGRCRVQGKSFSGTMNRGKVNSAMDPRCKGARYWGEPALWRSWGGITTESLKRNPADGSFYWQLNNFGADLGADRVPVWEQKLNYSIPNDGQIFNGVRPDRLLSPDAPKSLTNKKSKMYHQFCQGGKFTRYERPGSIGPSVGPPMGPVKMTPEEKSQYVEHTQRGYISTLKNPVTNLFLFPKGTVDRNKDQFIQVDYKSSQWTETSRFCVLAQTDGYALDANTARGLYDRGGGNAFCGYFRIPPTNECEDFVNMIG